MPRPGCRDATRDRPQPRVQDVTVIFESVLIANRGEIACRIIRTCRRLGIRTIAVYSAADAGALHVSLADESHCIGPAEAARSYLLPAAIIAAALAHRASAIHPGYGFLSERIELAELCAENAITWIGPSPRCIGIDGLQDRVEAIGGGARCAERAGLPRATTRRPSDCCGRRWRSASPS